MEPSPKPSDKPSAKLADVSPNYRKRQKTPAKAWHYSIGSPFALPRIESLTAFLAQIASRYFFSQQFGWLILLTAEFFV